MTDFYKKREIIRIENGKIKKTKDYIVIEDFYKIVFNGEEIFDIAVSPYKLEEMALGRVYVEGLISSFSEIEEIEIDREKQLIKIKSLNRKKDNKLNNVDRDYFYKNKLESDKIFKAVNQLSTNSTIFKKTGGVHNGLLMDKDLNELAFREDIARHNVVDKIIGYILQKDLRVDDKILVLSCRISTKIINKINSIGLKVVLSQSPPSLKAVQIAEDENITLIGFVRNKRMNIYSEVSRVIANN
ncbi:MAG: formate dehydrogenase accessory sulfurtransferase FdhD [Bacillota bacterium]